MGITERSLGPAQVEIYKELAGDSVRSSEDITKQSPDALTAYVRLWAALQFSSVGLGLSADASTRTSLACALAAAWYPSVPVIAVAFFANVVRYVVHMPYLPNGDWWGCLWDSSGVLLLVGHLAKQCRSGREARPSSQDTRERLLEAYACLARVQCIIIWASIACWKSNTSFFDYRVSCAPIIIFKVTLQQWCPQILWTYLAESTNLIAYYLVRISPGLTLAVEGGIPVLLCRPGLLRRLGLILALMLGLALGPWGAGFYNKLIIRYFLFVPKAAAEALAEVLACFGSVKAPFVKLMGDAEADSSFNPGASAWFILCLTFMAWRWTTAGSPFDNGPFFFYMFLAAVLLRALYLEAFNSLHESTQQVQTYQPLLILSMCFRQIVWWTTISVTLAYSLAFPMMGIQDMGVPNMFSNIALHGGSNHFFLPTGLLFAAFDGSDPAEGNPFAGGIIRVELTNSSILNELYPVEITDSLPSRTRSLLKTSGHIGRQWGPDGVAWMLRPKILQGARMPAEFTKYTVPAFELRQGLNLARAHNETFYLEYTRLPPRPMYPHGNASAAGVTISYYEDANHRKVCLIKSSQESCHDNELVLLPPPERSWMGRLLSKLLLSNAYAVLSGYETKVLCNAS